jgi:hypothetical protein
MKRHSGQGHPRAPEEITAGASVRYELKHLGPTAKGARSGPARPAPRRRPAGEGPGALPSREPWPLTGQCPHRRSPPAFRKTPASPAPLFNQLRDQHRAVRCGPQCLLRSKISESWPIGQQSGSGCPALAREARIGSLAPCPRLSAPDVTNWGRRWPQISTGRSRAGRVGLVPRSHALH